MFSDIKVGVKHPKSIRKPEPPDITSIVELSVYLTDKMLKIPKFSYSEHSERLVLAFGQHLHAAETLSRWARCGLVTLLNKESPGVAENDRKVIRYFTGSMLW